MWTNLRNSMTATKTANKPVSTHSTIAHLRESVEKAEKRQEHIQRKIDNEVEVAKKKMGRGDKRAALFAMKRKKLYEGEYEKLENVKMTLETQVIQIESAADNQATFGAMKLGTSTMARLRQAVGLEKIDEVMDDMREETDMAQEIQAAIGAPLDPYMDSDADLLAELASLEKDERTQAPSMFSMPSVPRFGRKANKADANDLKRLEAELAAS